MESIQDDTMDWAYGGLTADDATSEILDRFGLVISRVTDIVKTSLNYYSVEDSHVLESPFRVQLPQAVNITTNSEIDYPQYDTFRCKIQGQPLLHYRYWLTPAQTADGLYPFLLSNNKINWLNTQTFLYIKIDYINVSIFSANIR
ncbi:hypothetical protein DBV15_11742 [Temnothorax longispinosus]|uniref:Uncharacterized protein n=1 Tax=Temnothorax longispinosus TaxID=300112 RepID=A0A4S2KYI1_9HYME|nr:hypothetical protein DBV15_11742 [Temnothorax longispinosus]